MAERPYSTELSDEKDSRRHSWVDERGTAGRGEPGALSRQSRSRLHSGHAVGPEDEPWRHARERAMSSAASSSTSGTCCKDGTAIQATVSHFATHMCAGLTHVNPKRTHEAASVMRGRHRAAAEQALRLPQDRTALILQHPGMQAHHNGDARYHTA